MLAMTRYLYGLWILSLPFYSYSLFGTYSLDNLLAPFLLLLGGLNLIHRPSPVGRFVIMLSLLLLFLTYAFGRLVSVINNPLYFDFTMLTVSKQMIYLAIPVLYIHSREDWILTARLIIIVAIIGILSALVASLGLYDFPIKRFAESRLGVEALRKAVGLFSNYGDMAMLGSFALLYLHVIERDERSTGRLLLKGVATILILAGYMGTQSRNMYLTLFIGIMASFYFYIASMRGSGRAVLSGLVVILVCIFVVFVLTIFQVSTLETMKSFGGTREAAATVDARLYQYKYAWSIFVESPWFGHGSKVLEAQIEIHNIWLGLMALGGLVSTSAVAAMFLTPFLALSISRVDAEARRYKVFGLAQLLCIFVASEFYGAMTYIFLVLLGTMTMLSTTLPNPRNTRRRKRRPMLQGLMQGTVCV